MMEWDFVPPPPPPSKTHENNNVIVSVGNTIVADNTSSLLWDQ